MDNVPQLKTVREEGWCCGLSNMLIKETSWFRTKKKLLKHCLIWFVCLQTILIIFLSTASNDFREYSFLNEALAIFVQTAGFIAIFGVVVLVQGTIIDEIQSGTAAWVLSKPVSRSAFILAKLFSFGLYTLTIILLLQGLIAFLMIWAAAGDAPEIINFIKGLALHVPHLFFYLTITIMLGALFKGRVLVIGIPIALIIAQLILKEVLATITPEIVELFPGRIPDLAEQAVHGEPLVENWVKPIFTSSLLSIAFIIISLWQFGREEF